MRYQVGGSLRGDDPNYVIRQADEQLYASLKAGDFCYVFNSRQMGKTSLLQRTSYRLVAQNYSCAYLDVTRLGSEDTTPEQWYKGIILSLFYSFNLAEKVNFKEWWDKQSGISLVQQLHQFVEQVLLPNVLSDSLEDGEAQHIIIFIDEIDSLLSLSFPVSDFFAWIRYCYNQRSHNANFQRLGFALFGVTSPTDLIADKRRTPFNIGKAIELEGFKLHEAKPLLKGLEQVVNQPESVLREIIYWGGGQPFLTQKLCQLIVHTALETSKSRIDLPPETAAFWLEQLVQKHIIQHWESKDEPEHLRTIRDRLLFDQQRAGRLLGLYQQVLEAEELADSEAFAVPSDDSREQTELLLTGLVERYNGYLRIKNPIYRRVFNVQWVIRQLDNLRPYSQTFNAWVASAFQDESRLLRGKALQEVLDWNVGKSLSDLDYKFLAASQQLERQQVEQKLEAERLKAVEAKLALQHQSALRQRRLLIAVSLALVSAIALGIYAFNAYREAAINEIRAIASASSGSFNSQQHLDALVQAIEARVKFQRLNLLSKTDKNALELQTRQLLEQAVYGADEANRLWGHRGIVVSVAFSPNGQWIATSGTDRTIKIWQPNGTLLRTLPQSTTIHSVRFSPNSLSLAAAGLDGNVYLWTVDGKLLRTIKRHTAAVWRVVFSPDGQMIASASGDRTVKLWRRDGSLIRTLKHKIAVWGVAFSPDGQTLASSTVDGNHLLWRLNGTVITEFRDTKAAVWSIAFSRDGRTLVSGSADNKIRLWNLSGKLLKTLDGHKAEVIGVAFSPNGQTIASASADKTIKLWRVDGTLIRTFQGHSATIRGVAFSPDGQTLASASDDNTTRLWRIDSSLATHLNGHHALIWRVAFSPDGQTLASVAGQELKLWRRSGSLAKTLTIEDSRLLSLTFSPNGDTLAIAGADGIVRLWQINDNKRNALKSQNIGIWDVSYSRDGQKLVTVGDDFTLKLWQLNPQKQFQLYQSIPAHTARIWDVDYSPDGRFITTASSDGTVKVWRWSPDNRYIKFQADKTLIGHANDVWGVAISPDSQLIASAGRDDTLRIWRSDGTLVRVIQGQTTGLTRVTFSPDGKILAAASADGSVKLWKTDCTLLTTLSGHTSSVQTVAFSPDGKTLASAGDDQVVILWNLQQILNLNLLKSGCDWVENYLQNNSAVKKGGLC
jgi:WD40 repeat protein